MNARILVLRNENVENTLKPRYTRNLIYKTPLTPIGIYGLRGSAVPKPVTRNPHLFKYRLYLIKIHVLIICLKY